jgi:hypothetical protein
MGMCELCGLKMGEEVHHLQHQTNADKNGFIELDGNKIHKNNPANLITLCQKCHDDFHKNKHNTLDMDTLNPSINQNQKPKPKTKQHKKIKTTLGIQIYEM